MTKELIERFFKKQCTAKQAVQVANYLKNNPAILDKYLGKNDWDNAEPDSFLPEQVWDEVWTSIQKKNKRKTAVLVIRRTAVAACAAGLMGIGYYEFVILKNLNNNTLSKNALAANTSVQTGVEHKKITNNSEKARHLVLQDSSVIDLSPRSVVSYDVPFQNNKRKINLEGEAYFKVAKDKTKPFTVYAGGLATTALGTEFKITTRSGTKNNVTIKLFTGKVIIKSTVTNLTGWNKDVYLLAGEQVKYDADKMLLAISKIKNKDAAPKKVQVVNPDETKATASTKQLSFNNSSLPYVMEKLAEYFKVKIQYDKPQIGSMNFTGIIFRSDSLPTVLKIIAQMNDLEIVQRDDGFIVQRVQQ